jgi:hypothetical protein
MLLHTTRISAKAVILEARKGWRHHVLDLICLQALMPTGRLPLV